MDEKVLYMDRVATPLGDMIMTSHGEALYGLWFQGESRISLYSRRLAAGWNCISRGKILVSPLPWNCPAVISGSRWDGSC